jgi:hypothetical protein
MLSVRHVKVLAIADDITHPEQVQPTDWGSTASAAPTHVVEGTVDPGDLDLSGVVPITRLVNGQPLSADVVLTGADVSGVVLTSDARLTDARVPLAHTQAFSTITGLPTSLAGYGILDAVVLTGDARLSDARAPLAHTQAFSTITATPTTLAGYGIPAVTKTDVGLSAVENTALSTWAGSANLTTLGTIPVLTVAAGTLAAPSVIVGEATTGLSRPAAGVLKIGVGGTQVARFSVTDNNLGLGVSALSGASLTGTLNTAAGRQSLQSLTSGTTNTAVGASTGRQLTTQSGVTLVGYGAGDVLAASAATMVGAEAGVLSTVANDLFGYRAGYRLTTGNGNQFFGASVGSNQLTGSENFAAGFDVMSVGTGGTAIYNTVIGSTAGKKLLSGISNVFVGRASGQDAVSSNYGVFVGHSAGMHVLGDHNTAVGDVALFALAVDAGTGQYNTALGSEAAVTDVQANSVTTASFTTFLGGQSGYSAATQYDGCVAIGYRAKVTGASYLAAIGGAVGTGFELKVGIGVVTPTERLHVVGNARADRILTGDGTAALPGHSFITDPTTGLRLNGAGIIAFACGAANSGTWSASNVTIPGLLYVGTSQDLSLQRMAANVLGLRTGAGRQFFRVYSDGTLFGQVTAGAGTPEGVVTAPPGTLYLNTTGGANVSMYIKESGAGNTGWVAK